MARAGLANRFRRWRLTMLTALAFGLPASGAVAVEPIPRDARIVEGTGMAGLAITDERAIFARWGQNCVEGSCGWRVEGRPSLGVGYSYADVRGVLFMSTNIPGWRTFRGIGPGSSVADLRAAYGSRLRAVERCLPNGFVLKRSRQRGLALIRRSGPAWRYTFFRTGRPARHVREVVVGRTAYPPPPRGRCIDDVP